MREKHLIRCEECSQQFSSDYEWKTLCSTCYKDLRVNCPKCGSFYVPKGDWQVICVSCWKKEKNFRESKATVNKGNSANGEWLIDNMKQIIMLCHPDKHGGSEMSNSITRELIMIMKDSK